MCFSRALAVMLASLLIPVLSNAALIEVDLETPGDGLITRDTIGGLDWLDLNETFNLTYNEALSEIGLSIPAGFRFATQSEVFGLFAEAGVALPTSINFSDYTNAVTLMNLLGCTEVQCDPNFGLVTGTMDFDAFDPQHGTALQMQVNSIQQQVSTLFFMDPLPKDSGISASGNFLVRPIPEPGTGLLLGFGLIALGASCRR